MLITNARLSEPDEKGYRIIEYCGNAYIHRKVIKLEDQAGGLFRVYTVHKNSDTGLTWLLFHKAVAKISNESAFAIQVAYATYETKEIDGNDFCE